MTQIRNIIQSVQDRDVVKQAPDIVVYIDAKDYLVNPYLGNYPGVPVAFNDYIAAFQSSYDIEAMSPTCSITLAVPNVEDHLFRMPGGNNLINTMSELRVFSKGYYLSPRGNTVYRQVFRGYISSVNYTMDGKFTNIAVSAFGSLQLLDRMMIDITPSLMTASPQEATFMESTTWALDPYNQIAYVFLYSSMIDGFTILNFPQAGSTANINNSPYKQAVKNGYVIEWRAKLADLCRDVHVFPVPNVNKVAESMKENTKASESSRMPQGKATGSEKNTITSPKTEVQTVQDNQNFYEVMRGYLPEMGLGSLQLNGSKIVSRLERLRHFTTLVGLEAYQDIDGAVIIKPPLYNLDVLNVSDANDKNLPNTLADIYEHNNPFVVQLAEILSESESEDEAAVKMTRVLAVGSMDPGLHMLNYEKFLTPSEDIDIPKLAQFGLRMGPTIEAGWFKDGDSKGIFAYASTELAKANRGFRTYTITIPLRPELKLGFPMFLPHRDIYGYIKNVSINYTRGSSATMTVVLDAIRRRPMFPVEQNVAGPNAPAQIKTLLEPQKNLVFKWTTPPKIPDSYETTPELQGRIQTLPLTEKAVFQQDLLMQDYRVNKVGNSYQLPANTENCWRVQDDQDHIWDHERKIEPTPGGMKYAPGNDYYEDLRVWRPYTDEKGYEVIGTWPYGRFKTLRGTINLFTVGGILSVTAPSGAVNEDAPLPTTINPISDATTQLNSVQSFQFTGGATFPPDTASQLNAALINQTAVINDFKIFELTDAAPTTPVNQPVSTNATYAPVDPSQAITARVAAFLQQQQPKILTPAEQEDEAEMAVAISVLGS